VRGWGGRGGAAARPDHAAVGALPASGTAERGLNAAPSHGRSGPWDGAGEFPANRQPCFDEQIAGPKSHSSVSISALAAQWTEAGGGGASPPAEGRDWDQAAPTVAPCEQPTAQPRVRRHPSPSCPRYPVSSSVKHGMLAVCAKDRSPFAPDHGRNSRSGRTFPLSAAGSRRTRRRNS
jgi:hypothetical protein